MTRTRGLSRSVVIGTLTVAVLVGLGIAGCARPAAPLPVSDPQLRRSSEALEVVAWGPTEVLPIEVARPVVYVVFSQPMTALATVEEARSGPLSISPALPGRLRWLGSRPLSFEPDAPTLGGRRLGESIALEVTDLGITTRIAYNRVLVWVHSLSSGEPVADAAVSLLNAAVRTQRRAATGRCCDPTGPTTPLPGRFLRQQRQPQGPNNQSTRPLLRPQPRSGSPRTGRCSSLTQHSPQPTRAFLWWQWAVPATCFRLPSRVPMWRAGWRGCEAWSLPLETIGSNFWLTARWSTRSNWRCRTMSW